jgi:serine/threonine protein kinase
MDCETAEFCYLSPEVLRGDNYKPRSDMYGLGLAAWELWNQEMAFKQQRKTPLRQFIQTVKPTMLPYDDHNPLLCLICRCLTSEPEDRICSTTWVNEIRKLDILGKDEDDS